MELVKKISFIFFVILGSLLMIRSYFPIIRDIWVNQELSILKSSVDSSKKALAFVALMNMSYVLVHTLINKGNNYSDKVQSKKFKESLTPEMIKRLNDLEGKYE